jgi:ABC-type phosphate transport system substrate-binding protein
VRLSLKTAIAFVLLLASSAVWAQEATYKIVLNASNPTSSIKKDVLAQLFLSRKVSWAHGPAGDAVDQSMTSPIREAFSREILGMPLLAVQNHWRKRMLEVKEFPPLVKGTDAEVIAYVAKTAGGVGYVAASADLPPTVKTVKVADTSR